MNKLIDLIDDLEEFHVLIVDDKVNMRRTIRNMLRSYGLCCFGEADDGDKALKKLQGEYYDFIICDWNMPRMKGIELLRLLREDEELSELPFLMITGEATVDRIAEVIEAGVDGYILKPFDAKTFEEKIVEILANKKSEPSPLEAQILLAEHYMEVGCFWQSHQELDQASEISKTNPQLHYLRGITYEAEGQESKAEESFVMAKNYGPKFVKAYDKLAEIYLDKGMTEETLDILDKAIKISPNSPNRQMRFGQALLDQGKVKEATQAFNKTLKLDPGNMNRLLNIGDAYISAGCTQEAEKMFKACIASKPDTLYAYNRLGIVLRRHEKFDEAIDYYSRALGYAPEDENLHFNLARAYEGAKNRKMALRHLKKSLEIKPDFKEAKELFLELKQG